MNPDPVAAGLLLFGTNPATVDAAAGVLMGFDPEKIPIVRQAFCVKHCPISDGKWQDILCISNRVGWSKQLGETQETLYFEPHFGWKGHIERD